MPTFLALGLAAVGMALASILLFADFVVDKFKPDISWQQPKLEKSIHQGETLSDDFGFISNKELANVTVWVAPEIAPFVMVRPAQFERIQSGSVVRIQVIFTIPSDLTVGNYNGTVHIRLGNRTIAKPLPINMNVLPQPPPPPPPPPDIPLELFYDDGTAEAFDFDPVFGRAVFFTKFVASGQSVKILGAKIFTKIITSPPSPLDIYVWDFNRVPLIPPVRITPIEEGWFTVDLSSYNLVVANEFYIGIAWPVSSTPALLGVDLTSPQGKSFVVILSSNTFIPVSNANFMIRALVKKL